MTDKIVFLNPNKRKAEENSQPAKKVKQDVPVKTSTDKLPTSIMYEKSYMHTDVITHVVMIPHQAFLITMSQNGILKFWKKFIYDIEFVKQYKAGNNFNGITYSSDGKYLCVSSDDNTIKVFDILNFDMINIIKLDYVPGVLSLVHLPSNEPRLAVVEKGTNKIHVYNPLENFFEATFTKHSSAILAIKLVPRHNAIVTIDEKGMIEYSTPDFKTYKDVDFKLKSETDLFELYKKKTTASSIEFDKNGTQFVLACKDKVVRLFDFKTGKCKLSLDESMNHAIQVQQDDKHIEYLDKKDFDRRMNVEKTLDATPSAPVNNVIFDDSCNYIIYATYVGIKYVNIHTGQTEKILGKVENSERFLQVSLFQDKIQMSQEQLTKIEKRRKKAMDHNDSDQVLQLMKPVELDPCLFASSFLKKRFFIFSNRDPSESESDVAFETRDVVNEKPSREEIKIVPMAKHLLGRKAVIHTEFGDVFLDLYPDEAPKAVENFTVHSQNDYYNNLLFHRVIKGFMIQSGDPNGDGTGGKSIWGRDFEDEFSPKLRFDRPGLLAMANTSKPNTNGSQFFITTTVCPWLNDKHTIFGEVSKGFEVVEKIEKIETDKSDRPSKAIRIINVDVYNQ